jgi:hypothetical protein
MTSRACLCCGQGCEREVDEVECQAARVYLNLDARRTIPAPLTDADGSRSGPGFARLPRQAWSFCLSFQLSFHVALLGPTGAYLLDDAPDLSCKDSTRQHTMDGWPLSL